MGSVVARLRSMTDVGTADYAVGGVTYWTNDQVQSVLDRHSNLIRANLATMPQYYGGSIEYREFTWGDLEVERQQSGTAVWRVVNSAGSAFGTATYAVNYDSRRIRFTSDQTDVIYLETVAFDMSAAAADVWDQKAAHYAAKMDIQTGEQRMARGQLIQHAQSMAKYYRATMPARSVQVVRDDLA